MSNLKFPSIPDPAQDVASLQASVLALKETVEILTGQRRGAAPPVRWSDLVRLGIIEEGDVPR